MKVDYVYLQKFRNFKSAKINLNYNTLLIGANDIGKSNFLYSLRLLLDKSLSDADMEPTELDFHIGSDGVLSADLQITVKFSDVTEDAVLSIMQGNLSDEGVMYLRYTANKATLNYRLFAGPDLDDLNEINSRFYLKYVSLKYIQSQRDLNSFIRKEKSQLLKYSQNSLAEDERAEDEDLLNEIGSDLNELNEKISQLLYVEKATAEVNQELKKLAHHHAEYNVTLDAGAIQVNDFVERLKLGATSAGARVMLGGDGRNNQILLALWKARSTKEHDTQNEAMFYVVEEPEAHLHPHQQRKLADYLINELPGQTLISSHSPQISSSFKPDSIVRFFLKDSSSYAASEGCSQCIEDGWEGMSYRMSIIPAEAFFSNGVLLVEGPSELLFYRALAEKLSLDLDYYNLTILSVDGVSFKAYVGILNALEIPWVMRTDNDVSKVPRKDEWQYAGINRCLEIFDGTKLENVNREFGSQDIVDSGEWSKYSAILGVKGIFLSKIDLEHDLISEIPGLVKAALKKTSKASCVKYLQEKKALRMRELLRCMNDDLGSLKDTDLAKPLINLIG